MSNTSSFSMKRFMAHRRHEDPTTLPFTSSNSMDDIDSSIDKHLSKKQLPRAKPWLYAAGRRREPPTPVMIRRDRSIHKISSPLPPVPGDMPHSSTSSLCSCDMLEHIHPESRSYSSSKAAATLGLPDLPSTPGRSPSMLPPLRGPRAADRLLLSPEWTRSEQDLLPRPSITFSDSGIDPLDMRGIEARHAEMERLAQTNERKASGEYSENVRHFIRETDMAFKAAGPSYSDHKLDFHIPEEPSTPPMPSHPTMPSQGKRRSVSSLEDFSFDNSKKERTTKQTEVDMPAPEPSPAAMPTPATTSSPLPTPASTRTNSQPQGPPIKARARKTSKVVPFQGIHRPSRSQTGSRWNIPVAEILTGRFKKIEADEVLTPARIEELTKARAEALKEKMARKSIESARTSPTVESIMEREMGTDKPLPPMPSPPTASQEFARAASHSSEGNHSQRTGSSSSGRAKSIASSRLTTGSMARTASESASTLVDNDSDSDDMLGGDGEDDLDDDCHRVSPISEEGEMSPLPPKNPARFRGRVPPKQRLPSLPSKRASRRQSVNAGGHSEENDDYLFLKGTPFTLTKPMFRHGPITLSKADMGKVMVTMDDTLDWTAFQMAILGGAGELFPEEFEGEDDKMAEDLTDWFGNFGFESLGGLVVAEAPPSSRSSSRSTVSSIQSIRSTDQDLPIPISTERPAGLDESSGYDSSKFFRGSVGGPKPWMAEGDSPQRSKAETPPVTPLMPHVAGSDDEPGEVPMGYNLNQDLGDFLRWEAAHMTGAGF